jgi:TIR domain
MHAVGMQYAYHHHIRRTHCAGVPFWADDSFSGFGALAKILAQCFGPLYLCQHWRPEKTCVFWSSPMAYVPGCRYDLFISYARENNENNENKSGWVEQFERGLSQELTELLGRQFDPKESIFFDKGVLAAGQSFSEELTKAARDSAILVPILSPSYLTSGWCDKERTAFFSKLPDGAQPADCLAPILVRPIEESGLDSLYRTAQRLSFLSADQQTPSAVGAADWTAKLRGFAAQLKNALQKLRRNCKPVFLGKTAISERLEKLRVQCRAELECRHLRTVPEFLPALDDRNAVQESLQQSGLAIHFIGGAAPPIVLDAIEISPKICRGPTILYQPFGAELSSDEQWFLGEFERQLPSEHGGYQRLDKKNDQELLAVINELITQRSTGPVTAMAEAELALVCQDSDLDTVRKLKADILARRSMEIGLPDFLGNQLTITERRRKWNEYFSRGKAFLFYWNAAEHDRLERLWITAGEQKPDAPRYWFAGPPDPGSKREKPADALWEIDQVVGLIERARGAHA